MKDEHPPVIALRIGALMYGLGFCPLFFAQTLPMGGIWWSQRTVFSIGALWMVAGEYQVLRGLQWRLAFPIGAFIMVAAYYRVSHVAGLLVAGCHAVALIALLRRSGLI